MSQIMTKLWLCFGSSCWHPCWYYPEFHSGGGRDREREGSDPPRDAGAVTNKACCCVVVVVVTVIFLSLVQTFSQYQVDIKFQFMHWELIFRLLRKILLVEASFLLFWQHFILFYSPWKHSHDYIHYIVYLTLSLPRVINYSFLLMIEPLFLSLSNLFVHIWAVAWRTKFWLLKGFH